MAGNVKALDWQEAWSKPLSSRSLDISVSGLWKLPCCWSAVSSIGVYCVLSSSLYQEWQNTSKWHGTDQRASCLCCWGHIGGKTRAHTCCYTGRQAASSKTLWGLFGKGNIVFLLLTYVCLRISLCVHPLYMCLYACVCVCFSVCISLLPPCLPLPPPSVSVYISSV